MNIANIIKALVAITVCFMAFAATNTLQTAFTRQAQDDIRARTIEECAINGEVTIHGFTFDCAAILKTKPAHKGTRQNFGSGA